MLCRRQKALKVQIPEDEDIGTVTADGAYDNPAEERATHPSERIFATTPFPDAAQWS